MFTRVLAVLLVQVIALHAQEREPGAPVKKQLTFARGPFEVQIIRAQADPARAVVVFGSGDGGWSEWEDVVCNWLSKAGAAVVAVDLREYSKTDFNAAMAGKDFAAAAKAGIEDTGIADIPVIYAGWSMGAVQAVPAAASPERPAHLMGLLLLGADSRGRYGLRESDELGLTPKGPGTFALSEFTKAMENLRVAQFHGTTDFMASTAWIRTLPSTHTLYEVPGANHGFDGPSDDFEEWLVQGLEWVLGDDDAAAAPAEAALPFGLSPLWPIAFISAALALFFALSRRHSLRVLVWAVVLMGLIDLLESVMTKPPGVVAWMERWVPLGVSEKSRILLMISGLALLLLARGLRRRKRVAWLLTVALLGVSVLLHLSRAFDWHHALAGLVLLVPLIRWRREFVARSDRPSMRVAARVLILMFLTLFAYGVLSLRQLSQQGAYGADGLTWSECLEGSLAGAFAQKSAVDHQGSRDARNTLRSLRIGGLFCGLIVLAVLLRPVVDRSDEATEEERERARDLMLRHGNDPMDCFSLLPDKRYCFNDEGTGFVAYALWRNFAVALADPIGPPEARAGLVARFLQFCKEQDWEPVFYCSHVDNRPLYEEHGLITFKVGEDARLEVADFKLQGNKFQNLRTARNKAQKSGLTFHWYDATPHPDHGLEAQLQLLSDQWLKEKSGGEMTFDLGTFNIPAIRQYGAAIVRNPEGRMEAFSTWWPYRQGKGRCLDIMRARVEVRDVMDFLIVEAIDHFREQGVEQISLGNAPLANVAAADGVLTSRQERAVKFLFDNFDRFYGYKSLFNFKKKYQPLWQGRYLAYRPRVSLALVGLAIAGVHLPRGFVGLVRS